MNKNDFIKESKKRGIFKTRTEAKGKIERILDLFTEKLEEGEEINFVSFGTLVPTERKGKENVKSHLKTVEGNISIPNTKNVKFKIGKGLKEKLNV